jgi:hypothetical protein
MERRRRRRIQSRVKRRPQCSGAGEAGVTLSNSRRDSKARRFTASSPLFSASAPLRPGASSFVFSPVPGTLLLPVTPFHYLLMELRNQRGVCRSVVAPRNNLSAGRRRIADSIFEIQEPSPKGEFKIQNSKFKIQDSRFRKPYPKANRKSAIENPGFHSESLIPNPEY